MTTSHLTIRTAAVPDPVELERWRALLEDLIDRGAQASTARGVLAQCINERGELESRRVTQWQGP